MFLQSLKFNNFKNYSAGSVEFCGHINCLIGLNGSGKTNILDAIHYLSFTKSAFNSLDSQNIKHDETFFALDGVYVKNEKSYEISCRLKKQGRKVFTVDDSEYDKLSEHLGKFPVVMIAPNDDELIRESNEVRRKFFDSIIAQSDKEYLKDLILYNHHLKQKGALLKSVAPNGFVNKELLDSYDEILANKGVKIAQKRNEFISSFLPFFQKNYDKISNQKEVVSIQYSSKALSDDFKKTLRDSRDRDLITQRCNVGVHRDEYRFEIDHLPIKKYGSQGQQKSLLVSLKLAQFSFLKEVLGVCPILLLDDIFDKLDDLRIEKLLAIITSDVFKQIFITDAREERTLNLVKGKYEPLKVFRVSEGSIAEIKY